MLGSRFRCRSYDDRSYELPIKHTRRKTFILQMAQMPSLRPSSTKYTRNSRNSFGFERGLGPIFDSLPRDTLASDECLSRRLFPTIATALSSFLVSTLPSPCCCTLHNVENRARLCRVMVARLRFIRRKRRPTSSRLRRTPRRRPSRRSPRGKAARARSSLKHKSFFPRVFHQFLSEFLSDVTP